MNTNKWTAPQLLRKGMTVAFLSDGLDETQRKQIQRWWQAQGYAVVNIAVTTCLLESLIDSLLSEAYDAVCLISSRRVFESLLREEGVFDGDDISTTDTNTTDTNTTDTNTANRGNPLLTKVNRYLANKQIPKEFFKELRKPLLGNSYALPYMMTLTQYSGLSSYYLVLPDNVFEKEIGVTKPSVSVWDEWGTKLLEESYSVIEPLSKAPQGGITAVPAESYLWGGDLSVWMRLVKENWISPHFLDKQMVLVEVTDDEVDTIIGDSKDILKNLEGIVIVYRTCDAERADSWGHRLEQVVGQREQSEEGDIPFVCYWPVVESDPMLIPWGRRISFRPIANSIIVFP